MAASFVQKTLQSNGINLEGLAINDESVYIELPFSNYINLESLITLCSIVQSWGLEHLYLSSGGVWFKITRQNMTNFITGVVDLDGFIKTWEWVV